MELGRATMALGCIVVKASQVLQGGLVAELVLILRKGTGSVRASQGSHPPQPGVCPWYGLTLHPDALPLSAHKPCASFKTWLLSRPRHLPLRARSPPLAMFLQKSLGTL